MTLLLKFWPYIAGAFFVLGCGIYVYHSGEVKGRAEIQAKFSAFVAASDAVAAKQVADNERKRQEAEITNAQALATVSTQRDRAIAAGRATSDKLREYIAKAYSGAVPQAGDQPGVDAAAIDERIRALGSAVGDLRSECAENNSKPIGLQTELRTQL